MKNSIMKKTWGILLGFGLSLATAAFVLTGCVIEEDDSIAVSLKVTSVGNVVRVEITSGNAVWDSSYITGQANAGSYGVRGVFDFTLTRASGVTSSITTPSSPIPRAVSGDDTKLDFVYTIPSGWSGTAKVSANGMTAGYLGTYLNDPSGNSYVFDDFDVTITHFGADGTESADGVPLPASSTGGGGGGTATIEDLVTALGGETKVTKGTDTVTFKSGTTASVASGATVTVPAGVTLVIRNDSNGAAALSVTGTLVVNGTVETKSGLTLNAGGTISGNGTIKRGLSSNAALLQITSSGTYTIEGVTLQGMAPSGSTTINQYSVLDIQNGTVELTGVTIKDNTMTSGNGGGINISGGTVTLNGGTKVQSNSTTGNGGGAWVSGSGKLYLDNATIYGSKDNSSAASTPNPPTNGTAGDYRNYGGSGDALGFAGSSSKVYAGSGSDATDLTVTTSGIFELNVSGTKNATDNTLFVDATGNYSKAAR